ncbi:MAG TPA: hypothetical protein VFF06_00905 [Polyangia bacterium]|nr:hypothetical protein [Polyangia bacterium]
MSGEAGWRVTSPRFSLVILSGQPVWDARAASSVEQRLEQTYRARIAAVEELVEAARAELAIADFDPNAAAQPPRERVVVHARAVETGEGFNLLMHVTAPPRRERLDELARAIGELLFPGARLTVR